MSCSPEALEMLQVATSAALDALAEDPVAIDVTETLPFSDCFLIVTADNPRHLKSVSSHVSEAMHKDLGQRPRTVEGDGDAQWLLMDYGDLAVHVFLPDGRDFYSLEKLWGHAPRIPLDMGDEGKLEGSGIEISGAAEAS